MNIATAYPDSVAAKNWVRSYQLTDRELIVKDKFELKRSLAANEIHFMLWGDLQMKEGEVLMNIQGKKVAMTYDKNVFEASLETIPLNDPRLSGVWGKEIYRLTLKARKPALKGEYTYKILKK